MSRRLIVSAVAVLSLVVWMSGCKEDQTVKLKRGMDFAKAQLALAGGDPALLEALDRAEAEGNVVNYISGRMNYETEEMPLFLSGEAPKEWSVVIKPGTYPREYLIEGYGEDMTKPLFKTAVSIKAIPTEPKEEKKE